MHSNCSDIIFCSIGKSKEKSSVNNLRIYCEGGNKNGEKLLLEEVNTTK